jgi:hypothetical protein
MRLAVSLRSLMVATALAALVVSLEGPPWIAARKRSREKAAIGVLERIGEAEVSFRTKKARFGTLEELAAEGLVEPELALGARDGYGFDARPGTESPDVAWWATARPEAPWDGDRAYAVNGASGSIFETTWEPEIDRSRGEPLASAIRRPAGNVATWCDPEFLWFAYVVNPSVAPVSGECSRPTFVIFYTTDASFALNTTDCVVPGAAIGK